jgi:hypothetical protein
MMETVFVKIFATALAHHPSWALPFDGCASRPTEASYSSSSSFLTAAICRRSNSVTLTERHRSAARMRAPNINFKTVSRRTHSG